MWSLWNNTGGCFPPTIRGFLFWGPNLNSSGHKFTIKSERKPVIHDLLQKLIFFFNWTELKQRSKPWIFKWPHATKHPLLQLYLFFFFGLLFLSFLFSLSQFFIYLHVRMCVHNCVCIHAHIIRYVYDTCSIIIKCNCSLLNFFLSCLSSSAPNSSKPTRATQRHCYHRVKLQAAEP